MLQICLDKVMLQFEPFPIAFCFVGFGDGCSNHCLGSSLQINEDNFQRLSVSTPGNPPSLFWDSLDNLFHRDVEHSEQQCLPFSFSCFPVWSPSLEDTSCQHHYNTVFCLLPLYKEHSLSSPLGLFYPSPPNKDLLPNPMVSQRHKSLSGCDRGLLVKKTTPEHMQSAFPSPSTAFPVPSE